MGFATWLMSGQTIVVRGGELVSRPVFGPRQQLIPVGEGLFRLAAEVDATRVFTTDDDERMVLTGVGYAVRQSRWRVELVRVPVLIASLLLVSPLLMVLVWVIHATRAAPRGFWTLKATLLLASLCALPLAIAITKLDVRALGQFNPWTATIYASTLLLPLAGAVALASTFVAWLRGARRWLLTYALSVSCSAILVWAYLYSWGMVGFRAWNS
jgi:hypothetical protein